MKQCVGHYNICNQRTQLNATVVGLTTTNAISAYHHLRCVFESRKWRGVLHVGITLCDQVYQCLAAGQWFSLGTSVSSTNKPVPHDISEIFLNTITPPTPLILYCNHTSCVIVTKCSMLSPSMVYSGFESGQTKDYKIGENKLIFNEMMMNPAMY